MKLYIWQNDPATKWHIYYDFDHPLGIQLQGNTDNLFQRTKLTNSSVEKTATFRLNPHNALGELFVGMTFYQFKLIPDLRQELKQNCILNSDTHWMVQHTNIRGVQILNCNDSKLKHYL